MGAGFNQEKREQESERAGCAERRHLSGWEKKSFYLRKEVFLWTGELCNGNDEII